MIQQFRAHKADFETIRSMLGADKQLTMIHKDGSYGGGGVSHARVEEYLSLLRRAGLGEQLVSSRHTKDAHTVEITFGAFAAGKYPMGKGYIYSTVELTPLKETLDRSDRGWPGVGKSWYKRIEGNWYLHLENAGYD
jgi:hypothetical protein